ncbi:hypothetical protein [Streptomyces milbemycinicus]|uniref:Uncharacterized protein n=1 Tax=Streptomyces milbemycinicus TaxID=476552 RepID=A0ABW8M2L3_9ACTN
MAVARARRDLATRWSLELRDKDERHLTEAQVATTGPTARGRFGMCGRLDVYPGI